MYSYGPPHMAKQKQDDQPELTYSNYVRTQDVIQKTYRRRWMIGRNGERWSGISVLAARHDDDDDWVFGMTRSGTICEYSTPYYFSLILIISIQLNGFKYCGCTTWTMTKCIQKRLNGNCTRMLWVIQNKPWKQISQTSSCTTTYLSSLKPSK